ncbi:MAG TPA: periplasmic heavy metal sensor [Candidatus Krumholzibacteria bacterium]|nr:periplasmic heavy metal sensor [Candidatus Krumholzibacteria bacterium]
MKVKLLVGALAVLVIMNIAALGSFWFMHNHAPQFREDFRRGDRMGRWSGAPEMSPEDRRRLFRTMRSFHQEIRPLARQTADLEQDLIKSMGEDPVPRAHIDSLLEQISRNRLEIARRATNRMIAMGDSLSPEQREHMTDALMRMRRGGRGGPGDRDDADDRPMRPRRSWRRR